MAKGPLQRFRVVDLTRVWAGPLATRIIADLGAEVIKVEYRGDRGPAYIPTAAALPGVYPDGDPGEQPYNRQGSFNKLNRNKQSLVLDLQSEEGKAVFKRLVAISDVVIENFSARVMGGFGLSYAELRKINPSLIMVSMPGFGVVGPRRDYIAFGANLEPAVGLPAVMGYDRNELRWTTNAITDAMVGTQAAMVVLGALWRRSETGQGHFIDFSHQEAGIGMLGEYFLGYQLDGREPGPVGNRHPINAPNGCYRCAGDDEWVFLSVRDDDEFAKLCDVVGHPEWALDTRFSCRAARRQNQSLLDTQIEEWTAARAKHAVMQSLQAVGIPAGAVLKSCELVSDPHLAERRFFVPLDHPVAGRFPYPGLPVRMADEGLESWTGAPLLGQHNHEVLEDLLGFSRLEVDELQSAGVIADKPEH